MSNYYRSLIQSEPIINLLLDSYPATAAYSLRKLRTAYTGSAIRVRRSSDNKEQDIGFNGSGGLNTTSLLSFVGAGDGFITTWYDQQGSNNLTQTTAGNQPQIVNAGTTITRGGKPSCKFNGTSTGIENFSSAFLNVVSMSYFSVSNNEVSESIGTIHTQHSSLNGSIRTFCDRRTTTKRNLFVSGSISNGAADMSTFRNSADQRLLSGFIDGSKNMSSFDNGVTGITDSYSGSTANDGLRLGNQGAGITFLNGTIQEFIAYNTDESANRTDIENNINAYYNIY